MLMLPFLILVPEKTFFLVCTAAVVRMKRLWGGAKVNRLDFATLCVAGSQLGVHKTLRELFLAWLRLLSGAPDALTHPIWNAPQVSGL